MIHAADLWDRKAHPNWFFVEGRLGDTTNCEDAVRFLLESVLISVCLGLHPKAGWRLEHMSRGLSGLQDESGKQFEFRVNEICRNVAVGIEWRGDSRGEYGSAHRTAYKQQVTDHIGQGQRIRMSNVNTKRKDRASADMFTMPAEPLAYALTGSLKLKDHPDFAKILNDEDTMLSTVMRVTSQSLERASATWPSEDVMRSLTDVTKTPRSWRRMELFDFLAIYGLDVPSPTYSWNQVWQLGPSKPLPTLPILVPYRPFISQRILSSLEDQKSKVAALPVRARSLRPPFRQKADDLRLAGQLHSLRERALDLGERSRTQA